MSFRNEHSFLAGAIRALGEKAKRVSKEGNPSFLEDANVVEQPAKVREWREKFVRLVNRFSHYQFSRSRIGSVAVVNVFEDTLVTGIWSSSKTSFQVFVRYVATKGGASVGCSCEDSSGNYICSHSYMLLEEIIRQLKDSISPLYKRLATNDFDTGKQDMSIFEYDKTHALLSKLDELAGAFRPESLEMDSLPTKIQADPSRVVWSLETSRNSFHLTPKLQVATKRGFSKGKKSKLDALYRENVILSPADLRVRNLIEVESDYYDQSLKLDVGEALFQLVGEPNVQLDGEPATVSLGCGILQLMKREDQYVFRLKADEASQVGLEGDFLVTASSKSNAITVFPGTESQLEVLLDLLRLEPISAKQEAAIIERAKKLQKVCNLILPEVDGGKCRPGTAAPLIILRSCKDGALDYGIRVRDSLGKIHKPCEGIMVHSGEINGVPTQLVRQPNVELEIANELCERLNLPTRNYEGSLDDFASAFQLIETLQTLGTDIEVLWDKASEKPMRVLGTVTASNVRVGISQKRDWFNLTGQCKFGDETLDIATLMQSLREASISNIQGDFVRVGDAGWARISDKLRKSLRQLDDSVNVERGSMRFDKTSAFAMRAAQEFLQIDSTKAWNECLQRLERAEKMEPVLPAGLTASLREYQLDGYKWLRRLAEWGVGGILADDMGLGKTLQTLAVILDRAKEGPSLVIAPTSVGFNWIREVNKFAPELTATLYRETDRAEFLDNIGPNQIVVCSYGLALRDIDKLAKVAWNTMVLDEAQAIKNSRSKTSLAVATIPSKWTVALTGTPVENHLGELWSLFHVVSPGVLGGWDQFRTRFAGPIEKSNDEERKSALRNRLTPFILRRTKSEVLKDLPPRTEMNLLVELSPAERAVYENVRMSAIGEADSIAKLNDIKDQRFRILALLTRLRQIACHPGMVHDTWKEGSAKLTQLAETLHELRGEGHRVLIFSQFVKHLTLIREMLEAEGNHLSVPRRIDRARCKAGRGRQVPERRCDRLLDFAQSGRDRFEFDSRGLCDSYGPMVESCRRGSSDRSSASHWTR